LFSDALTLLINSQNEWFSVYSAWAKF
jgi:hypothetical protein